MPAKLRVREFTSRLPATQILLYAVGVGEAASGGLLREARLRAGLTQTQLATRASAPRAMPHP